MNVSKCASHLLEIETGSFKLMNKAVFKFLTLNFFLVLSLQVAANILVKEKAKSHLRWNLYLPKDQVVIHRKGLEVKIQTLDWELFEKIQADIKRHSLSKKYFKGFTAKQSKGTNVASIELTLASPKVEFFHFYRERDKRYIMDFWQAKEENAPIAKKVLTPQKTDRKTASKKLAKAKIQKSRPLKKSQKMKEKAAKTTQVEALDLNKGAYRDFRYGASFIWNYKPFLPRLSNIVNLERKTPEFFHPIKNREFEKDEKESHLQLVINLYRKKKLGLMYKAIKLYQQKYGDDNIDDIEYIKANAIIRDNFQKGNTEPRKMAMSMLKNLAERTENYELQRSIYKYLLQYLVYNKEYVEGLRISKLLYVKTKENFDYEESHVAAEAILYNLAQLGQIDKIEKVLLDKTLAKILPRQMMLAYKYYVHLERGETEQIINSYVKEKKGFTGPVHEAILFNVAEAYFQNSQYQKSVAVFDKLITQHSYHDRSGHARLRIALSYDLLGRDPKLVKELYKKAINRTTVPEISFEAKMRYVALSTIRKRNLEASDLELRTFLEISKDQKKYITSDLKKLLWLVRLRSFIVDSKYKEALSYLNAIPLITLKPLERRVFEADGAEIIQGIIEQKYKSSEYSDLIKIWELYKDRYVNKVANDPYMNFVVGTSFIKMGLFDGFDKVFYRFKTLGSTPDRTFPIWVDRKHIKGQERVLEELKLIKNLKLKNWELAKKNLLDLEKVAKRYIKVSYYRGVIHYEEKNYKEAARNFENFLANTEEKLIYDPGDVALLIGSYTDSLYELNQLKKYEKVSRAILSDTENYAPSDPFLGKVREKLAYFLIEIMAGKASKEAYVTLEPEISRFKEDFPSSIYKGRIDFLLGVAFIKNKKVGDGKKLLQELIKREGISNYIKELAKSELTLLNIKNRTI